ncbi:protein S100-A5-like [Lepisosteus oculatus]|uniref:protein S100-A5-like n=1 Tax=Lepisosteus oculatus TaxID=7918 RepID=UPI000740045F|nr:PREDICTED: protein S100-A4-like [Lepisosteus oculatus]
MSLEQAAKIVSDVFYKYAGEDDKKQTLSRDELKKLLQAHCSHKPDSVTKLDKLVKRLDDNKDNQIDIVEFGALIGMMAKKEC